MARMGVVNYLLPIITNARYGMRIFWWQGGIHMEPENEQEIDALMVLWDGIKKGPAPEFEVFNGSESTAFSGTVVHGKNNVITGQ